MPGAPGPSLEDFVARIHKRVEAFAGEHGGQAAVEVELRDGAVFRLLTIEPEPGYGFVTLCPYSAEEEPSEMIVPVGAIASIRLRVLEEHPPFGFTKSGD